MRNANSRVGLLVGPLMLGVVSCSAEEQRAPLLQSDGRTGELLICDRLRQDQPQAGDPGTFWTAGGPAACPGEGQYCPAAWLSSRCDGGQAFALCEDRVWHLVCVVVDGGADGA
ncbi:MAG: hypothetical protein MUF54_00335 [Polyangiaceae bacterium]|jgi:hypothetical protein|nr:hypothetical protein [Polyangiaceae bacterium]